MNLKNQVTSTSSENLSTQTVLEQQFLEKQTQEIQIKNIVNFLTICRKAGKITMGFDAVKDGALSKEILLVLVTTDISPKTLKEINFYCGKCTAKVMGVPLTMEDLWKSLGRKVGIIGITDKNFADAFCKKLEKIK